MYDTYVKGTYVWEMNVWSGVVSVDCGTPEAARALADELQSLGGSLLECCGSLVYTSVYIDDSDENDTYDWIMEQFEDIQEELSEHNVGEQHLHGWYVP